MRPSRVINLEQSSNLTLFSHQASSIELLRNRLALMQTLPELRQHWPFRNLSNLSEQIIRQRQAGPAGARLQCAMQRMGLPALR
jgi:hypothetical protein